MFQVYPTNAVHECKLYVNGKAIMFKRQADADIVCQELIHHHSEANKFRIKLEQAEQVRDNEHKRAEKLQTEIQHLVKMLEDKEKNIIMYQALDKEKTDVIFRQVKEIDKLRTELHNDSLREETVEFTINSLVECANGAEAGIYWIGENKIQGWTKGKSDKDRSVHSWDLKGQSLHYAHNYFNLISKKCPTCQK